MRLDFQERARWLERHILPNEPQIRSYLKSVYLADLDVNDIIQEMYARIMNAPDLESIRYPKQYAVQTAKRIIIDHCRRSRIISITLGGSLEQLDTELPETSVEERLQFQGDIEEVANVIAQLPAICRETLILRRVEGLSQKDAAKRLGISEKRAEYYLARGALLLATMFGRGKSRSRSSNNKKEQVGSRDGTL